VMLMLTVVIIIAAIVSATAGGFSGSLKTPAKTLMVNAEFDTCGLLTVSNEGGDSLVVGDYRYFLTFNNKKYPIKPGYFLFLGKKPGEFTKAITLSSQETMYCVGEWYAEPTYVYHNKNLTGMTAKFEIFDNNGLPVVAKEFAITDHCMYDDL